MTTERLEQIVAWRKRVGAKDLRDAGSEIVTAVLEQWLMLIDELLEEVKSPSLH